MVTYGYAVIRAFNPSLRLFSGRIRHIVGNNRAQYQLSQTKFSNTPLFQTD